MQIGRFTGDIKDVIIDVYKRQKEINQAKLTRVGFGKELYNKGEDEDAYQNLFGDTIEPWHNCYGDLSNDDKNKQLSLIHI